MSFEIVDEEFEPKKREYKTGPRGPLPRKEEQVPWDQAFERAMNSNNVLAVQVAPELADDAAKRVASSARYYDRSVTEGVPKPGKAENTVILTWKIRIPKKRGPKKTSETSAE
jgi:hypothetical protein